MRPIIVLLSLVLLGSVSAHAKVTRYLTGNGADATPSVAGPVLLLGGGGTDVDSALQATIDAVRGCTGCATAIDIVILRATGADGYNDYLYAMNGVDSVETLVITKRTDASATAVIDTVQKAELVFFAGGDQCNYVTLFKGTPVETAVEAVFARGGAVGGTSAGEAIQGSIVYDACVAGATSAEILANPYARSATFTTGFFNWPNMADTLTEQHTVARDRMGRLMGFLARQLQDGVVNGSILGIAADEQTSILVARNGIATVYGNPGTGRAYFVLADHKPGAQERVQPKKPLTYLGYKIWYVEAGGSYDLGSRNHNGAQTRIIDVIDGVLSANPY